MRKWSFIGLLGLIAVLAIGFAVFTLPQSPFARPGEAVDDRKHPHDPANRAEDEIPGENPAIAGLEKAVAEGNQELPFRMEGGVKVFDLTAMRVAWEVKPGEWIEAWTYNGTVPGPVIRVNDGDRVRINFKNELPDYTAVHWHGQVVPWGQDGVPGLTQPAVPPGESYVYEFTAGPMGTHWYHTHYDTTKQVTWGLFGAFVIEPRGGGKTSPYDREHIVFIQDAGALGLTMNGRGYPLARPLMVREGERVLIRMINAGLGPHPMHLHGHVLDVIAMDGAPLHVPIHRDTIPIFPGETIDFAFDANNPGAWLWHCHMPNHAEGPVGMFGLTQEIRYEGVEGLPPPGSAATHGGHH